MKTLETERLILREWKLDDISDYLEFAKSNLVGPNAGWKPVNSVLDYSFNESDLDLVWCGHFEDNQKSKRVNEKCGFTFQFKKERVLHLLDNKRVVQWYYNISKEDFHINKREK